jgi:AAA15 family ATPase/GTPase
VWSMCVCVVILLSTMRLNYSNKNTAYFRFTHQTTLIDSKSSPVDDIWIVCSLILKSFLTSRHLSVF